MPKPNLPHLQIPKSSVTSSDYKPVKNGGGGGEKIPERDISEHAQYLLDLIIPFQKIGNSQYLLFESKEDYDIIETSLDNENRKMCRLFKVDGKIKVVSLINEKAFNEFAKILNKSIEKTNNLTLQKLYLTIENIKQAKAKDLWNDDIEFFPKSEYIWCEAWLAVSNDKEEQERQLKEFIITLSENNIEHNKRILNFPDTVVMLVKADKSTLEKVMQLSNGLVAEFRARKELVSASFLADTQISEREELIKELKIRIEYNNENNITICILDGGVFNKTPLLSSMLEDENCYSWGCENPTFDENNGHGTKMAGIAIYGDKLKEYLSSNDTIVISHGLESVKFKLDEDGSNKELYGFLTEQLVALPEIRSSERKRLFCMAVTCDVGDFDRGKPSSWSAKIDNIIYNPNDPDKKRLFIVSAGNNTDFDNYPQDIVDKFIGDPAQACNAITVGSFTNLDSFSDGERNGVMANRGGISPYSSTSFDPIYKYPIKPDVVFEGGNLFTNSDGHESHEDLDLLTTGRVNNPLVTFNATSLSTALASNFIAQLYVEYPNYWPETIRGLMIHSSAWTEELKSQIKSIENVEDENKGFYGYLLRFCGYGVPDLERAKFSARNRLTLISEQKIQPFKENIKKSENTLFNEIHYYKLPWPKEELEKLTSEKVMMRVTLSYYIEAYPRDRGYTDKYKYASYNLKFDKKRPTETENEFKGRVNEALRDAPSSGSDSNTDDKWLIGIKNRGNASIQSDIWIGTATDLAESDLIAVYPVNGWWKKLKKQNKANSIARYSLIVSIYGDDLEVDIYTPVQTQIAIANQIPTTIITPITT